MQPVRGCIHFARVIRPSCDVRERVRDSCAEVTALQGRVILLIDHQEFSQNKFPDKFSWKRTISEGFSPVKVAVVAIYAWNAIINFTGRKNRFLGVGSRVYNFIDFTFLPRYLI